MGRVSGAFEALRQRILEQGCEEGGRLDIGCFWCGGDDIDMTKPPGRRKVDHIIHRADCLYILLENEVAEERGEVASGEQ